MNNTPEIPTRIEYKRGPILKEWLDERGTRYKHVAEKTGIDYQNLLNWMSGERKFPEDELRLIARKCDIPLDIFYLLPV